LRDKAERSAAKTQKIILDLPVITGAGPLLGTLLVKEKKRRFEI
jgi:hypothetical protein